MRPGRGRRGYLKGYPGTVRPFPGNLSLRAAPPAGSPLQRARHPAVATLWLPDKPIAQLRVPFRGPLPTRPQLLRDVRTFLHEEREPDVVLLATKLSSVGYSVAVRTALGGGAACFRNLRNEFLAVRGRGDYEGVEFLVEPRFRDHFLIPHPTGTAR